MFPPTFLARLALAGLGGLAAAAAHGALNASDDASNYASWTNGSNGGSNFGAWVFANTSGNGGENGQFLGSSSGNGNGASGNIDTGGQSWGMYANNGQTANATRPFSGALTDGQTFRLSLDNGNLQNGAVVGFSLRDTTNANRFEFYFAGGNASYTLADGGGTQSTTHGFTADGLQLEFTLTGADSYSFRVTFNTGTPTTETFTGALSAGGGIDRVRLFNFNAGGGGGSDAFFNSIAIVPEPTTWLAAAGLAGLVGWTQRRRFRAVRPA